MNTATFNISKTLVVIAGNSINEFQIGKFADLVANYTTINFTGVVSISKMKKYVSILTSNGFTVSNELWINENNPCKGAVSFNIEFSK